jgi:hypothetical protein
MIALVLLAIFGPITGAQELNIHDQLFETCVIEEVTWACDKIEDRYGWIYETLNEPLPYPGYAPVSEEFHFKLPTPPPITPTPFEPETKP